MTHSADDLAARLAAHDVESPNGAVRVAARKMADGLGVTDARERVQVIVGYCRGYEAALRALEAKQGEDASVKALLDRLRSPETIDRVARTMARMVYGFGHAERITQYTSPEIQREHVKIAGYVIHAAIQQSGEKHD